MEQTKYLSIAEFAEAAGVSKQAVYKRIEKDLAPFCEMIDGKKCLNEAALDLFKTISIEQPPKEKVEQTDKDSIKYLLLQLEEKDKLIQQQQDTIERQTEQISGLQQHIIEQSVATTEILKKQSQLQENFQILLGQQQKQLQAVSTVENIEQPVEQPIEQPVEKPKKKGLLSRLFGD